MVGMLLLEIVLNRIGSKDSSMNVVSGMGRAAAYADVVQCNVRVGGRSVR